MVSPSSRRRAVLMLQERLPESTRLTALEETGDWRVETNTQRNIRTYSPAPTLWLRRVGKEANVASRCCSASATGWATTSASTDSDRASNGSRVFVVQSSARGDAES
jgi:hypothetical protein